MSIAKRLTTVLESAAEIPVDETSRIILFSDCHRGDNSWADDFAKNQNLFFHALSYYLERGFTYIELGDGDELMENARFSEIRRAHSDVFWLMREFHLGRRLHLLYGNHDMERQDPRVVRKTLYQYDDERTGKVKPLFEGIVVREGLILNHQRAGQQILLVHGHQGDAINDRYWRVGRFFVRHFWRHLQLLGVPDPTSAAKNAGKRSKLEREITAWVKARNQMLIAGHTHRPRFPAEGDPPYFNDGSCVHPRCITGIEIDQDEIALIKWAMATQRDGTLFVARDVLAGPRSLREFGRH
jgi:predicted phosphodiesterase